MNQPEQEKNNIKKSSQNRWLPIILWLFPLFLLNIGNWFFNRIDSRWNEEDKSELSRQEVEALAANSEFSYCFSRLAGEFGSEFKTATKSFSGNNKEKLLLPYLKSRSEYRFRAPFPDHELFVFKMPTSSYKPELFFTNIDNVKNKRALCMAFEYLTRVNSQDAGYSEANRKKGSDITKNIWGGETEPEVIAETQCGKVGYAFYKHTPNRFVWDYFLDDANSVIYGFFIIVDNNNDTETSAKLIALRELRYSQQQEKDKKYGAFIPLFPGYGGVVAQEEAENLPGFDEKIRKWVPENFKKLYDWQFKASPFSENDCILDGYKANFYIAPGQSHASVLFTPIDTKSEMPAWLFSVNWIVIFLVTTLLVRGFLLGIWPRTSLKARFITTFFLAACLPLGLLVIASYGYLSEYIHTSLFKNQSRLRQCFNYFDSYKTQVQDEYKTAFLEIQNDSDILESFKKLDGADKAFVDIQAQEVLRKSLKILNRKERELPILSMTIIDEYGGYYTNIGNGDCYYYVDSNHNEIIKTDKNLTLAQKRIKTANDDVFDALIYSLINSLRNRIEIVAPESKKWTEPYKPSFIQETVAGSFRTAVGDNIGSLSEEFDRRRNTIISRNVGSLTLGHIHNYIFVDGIPRFIVLILWDTGSLDEKTFKSSLNNLALSEPNFSFSAYKSTAKGAEPWINTGRHGKDFEQLSNTIANQAHFRKSNASLKNDSMSVLAVPSKTYVDTIITGGFAYNNMAMSVFTRVCILVFIILIALIVLLACIYYSFKIFLKPVFNLKQSLEEVTMGNFNISIKSSGEDEFCVMGRDFSEMTKGLNERNKLATLLSDQAIEALSKNNSSEYDSTDVETFSGVALVTDIRNFTGMCECYEPSLITDLLNEHFARMTKIISEHGGRIYKYIGDAIEVVFANNDLQGRSSVEQSLETAFLMLKCLKKINEERKEKGLFTYKIGIGLCFGKMLSGTIGSFDTRLDYAVIGDTLKKAAKLESFTKLYPEFPLVVNDGFTKEFSKLNNNIDFKKIIELEENSISEQCFHLSETDVENFINSKNILKKENSDFSSSSKAKSTEEENKIKRNFELEIDENFSFARVFIPGILFIILLCLIFVLGSYWVWQTKNNIEKNYLALNNESDLNQILCDDYGKAAFDAKARYYVSAINKVLKDIKYEDITDNDISDALNKTFEKDVEIQKTGFKFAFIKSNDNPQFVLSSDTSFIDKFSFHCICNHNYSQSETDKIVLGFKVCEALRIIDKNTELLKLQNNDKQSYQRPFLLYLKDNYGEPFRDIFGEKVSVSLLKTGARNSTIDGKISEEAIYLFWFDFYVRHENQDKLIGYFICSMSAEEAKTSIPFLLNAYSINDTMIALKNRVSGKWSYSSNIPDYIKANIEDADQKCSNKDNAKNPVLEYLNCLQGVSNNGTLAIGNIAHDIYFTKLSTDERKLHILIASIIVISMIIFINFLIKISQGKSVVSRSVAAKLWLALLIVAVIPVSIVFFVYGLFRYEHYSVRTSQKHSDMQQYCDVLEAKQNFSTPLIWNFAKNKTNSKELYNLASILNSKNSSEEQRKKALIDIRSLCESWMRLNKVYTELEERLINFNITDISISGSRGWYFCLSDTKDSLEDRKIALPDINNKKENTISNSVSYIDEFKDDKSRDGIGIMLSLVAKSLLNKRGVGRESSGKVDKEMVANEIAIETSLKAVRTFCGDDTFVKLSHSINLPLVVSFGIGKVGFYLSTVPDYEKPEFIIVWMVSFSSNDYLNKISDVIESPYDIYPVEIHRCGEIASSVGNDWRVLLGKLTTRMFSTGLHVSTMVDFDNEKYFVESSSSRRQLNSIAFLSCSAKDIFDDLSRMDMIFALLLFISFLVIVYTTKNIAEDILNPLNSLISGIKEINNENFSYRIESDRTDELGALCYSFDHMAKGLEEKHMMSKMISKTAQMVTLKESADATRKTDCVLVYVSIPNFLAITANLDDVEIFKKLKRQTAIVAGKIMECGGEVDKIMGEKLLAVFRIKNDDKKSTALAACNAAKKIIELEKLEYLPFPVAIGINYGNVINGFLGVGSKRDFTVIGDAVNVTARIESLSEKLDHNRFLISEVINNLIDSDFSSELYGEVELKGKSQPMKVYQLI